MTERRFSFLTELAESHLFPSVRSLSHYDAKQLAEITYLTILGLRILLADDDTRTWARDYCRKAASAGHFRHWRTDGNDLYCLMHALTKNDAEPADTQGGAKPRDHGHVAPSVVLDWLKDVRTDHPHEERTRRFFLRIDVMFRIPDGTLRSLRRRVIDWPELDRKKRREALTDLLHLLRTHAPKSEILPKIDTLAHAPAPKEEEDGDKDSKASHSPSKRRRTTESFLAGLAKAVSDAPKRRVRTESATAGATGAASVATVVGGLGAGFDPNGHKGIYQDAPVVIRRTPAPKKPRKKQS